MLEEVLQGLGFAWSAAGSAVAKEAVRRPKLSNERMDMVNEMS